MNIYGKPGKRAEFYALVGNSPTATGRASRTSTAGGERSRSYHPDLPAASFRRRRPNDRTGGRDGHCRSLSAAWVRGCAHRDVLIPAMAVAARAAAPCLPVPVQHYSGLTANFHGYASAAPPVSAGRSPELTPRMQFIAHHHLASSSRRLQGRPQCFRQDMPHSPARRVRRSAKSRSLQTLTRHASDAKPATGPPFTSLPDYDDGSHGSGLCLRKSPNPVPLSNPSGTSCRQLRSGWFLSSDLRSSRV